MALILAVAYAWILIDKEVRRNIFLEKQRIIVCICFANACFHLSFEFICPCEVCELVRSFNMYNLAFIRQIYDNNFHIKNLIDKNDVAFIFLILNLTWLAMQTAGFDHVLKN